MKKFQRAISTVLCFALILSVIPISISAEADTESLPATKANTSNIKVGDYITLGKYLGEPIVWQCVDIDEHGPLMLSKKILCNKAYDAAGESAEYHTDGWGYIRKNRGSNCWSDSSIRQWLNSIGDVEYTHCPPEYQDESGFLSNFSAPELALVKTVTQKSYLNEWETHRTGYVDGGTREPSHINDIAKLNDDTSSYWYQNVTDKFFLLERNQLYNIYENNPAYLYAEETYFTRYVGNSGASYENIFGVGTTSNFTYCAEPCSALGIRPAFYLNVDDYGEDSPLPDQDKVTNNPKKEYRGHYYQLFDISLTWEEAKKECESLGGYLATITSKNEQAFVEALITTGEKNCYWLGAEKETTGYWQWVTGEEFDYANWKSGEPNNEKNIENYLEMYAKVYDRIIPGQWNDITVDGTNGEKNKSFYSSNSIGFICEWDNVSSEYSNLMGDAWKNAGMENINEYLLTMPSIARAVVNSYHADQSFMKEVAKWKYIEYFFEPGERVDDAISLKDYYSSVLLSLINASIADKNYAKQITEAGKFDEIKISSEISKLITSCDDLDHERLLSGGTCTIEEITKLNNKINSTNVDLNDYSSAVSVVGKFLKAGTTINESINLYINYSNVKNTSTYIIDVLNKIKENSSDPLLAIAVDEIVYASESSYTAIETGLCEGIINAGKDYGVELINAAWGKVLESTPLGKGLLIGYKIGKPLSNALCATDAIISNYFDFVALCEVERALKVSITDLETDFYNNKDADSSLNYINAVALCFKVYYLSLDYATNLSEHSNLCPFAYVFYNGKQQFEDAIAQYASTRSGLKEYEDLLFRLWAYSLKEQYPDIYAEILPSLGNLYQNDLSSALVRLEYLSKTYTGEELMPTVTVTMGSAVLMPSEYTVTYHNNVDPGVATVQITAVEGSLYTGTKAASFTIKEFPFERRLSIRGSLVNYSTFKLYSTRNGVELPDVYFYDGEQLVAAVENGVITKDDLPIYITENGIDVLMHDKDYTVEISGDSDLTYNAELQKLDENYSIIETSNYNNLLLSDDIQCNIYADAADEVIVNDSIQTPDYTSTNTSNNEDFPINSEQCETEDSAYEGQRVYVGAIIPEGHIFTGWTISPQVALSSNSAVTSFIMPSEPVSIIANFAENPSYFDLKDTIVKAAEIGSGKYTKSSYAALQLVIESSMLVLMDDIADSLSKEKIAEIQSAVDALDEVPALAFKGASLSLQHNLAINYKVDKALFEDVGYTNPYVVFELNGVKTKVSGYTVSGERYVFTFRNIAPDQMNDTIYATLHATYNGVEYASETREYSVVEYCYSMLELYSGDEYSELRTLLVDLLNYGAASQVFTDYKTDALANADLTETQKQWATSNDPTLETVLDTAYATVENPSAVWKGAGLNLQESVSIRLKFIAENIEDLKVKITSGTKTWSIYSDKFIDADGVYQVYFTGLDVSQMREKVYFTIYEGDTPVSNTVCYSIGSYAYEKQNSTINGLSDLVVAMMKYGDSAYAYTH